MEKPRTAVEALGIDAEAFRDLLARAFAEDLGAGGDRTTRAVGLGAMPARGLVEAKQELVVAGLPLLPAIFERVDPSAPALRVTLLVEDGTRVTAGAPLARIEATLGVLLAGERVALNLLGHLSGIATVTRRYVDAVAGTGATVADTRKTLPGLRSLEKYAVRTGGGENHRVGLYDAILLKNNHVDAAGGVAAALERVRASGDGGPVEVEVRDHAELEAALAFDPEWVLLDNFTLPDLARAVTIARGRSRARLEASGGVSLATVGAIAATGVDRVSVGALTHSATWADVHLVIDRD